MTRSQSGSASQSHVSASHSHVSANQNHVPESEWHTNMPVTRSKSGSASQSHVPEGHRRGGTVALRIQFNGYNGQKVLHTSPDDIQSLVPWLKSILSTLQLPHPKPTNVIRRIGPIGTSNSIIEMFWDHAESTVVRVHVLHPPFC